MSCKRAMKFFDSRKAKKEKEIGKETPIDTPVILMFDNINMYQEKRKHLHLFKYMGPTMSNFTGQAVLIPNVAGMGDLIRDKNACLQPPKRVLQLNPEDVFIQSDQANDYRKLLTAP